MTYKNQVCIKINCNMCDKVYVNKTRINLDTRLQKHKRRTKNVGVEKLALAKHVFWNWT